MKNYLRTVATLVLFAGIYGVIVPSLISLKDSSAVATGLALAILTPPCLYALFKGMFNTKD